MRSAAFTARWTGALNDHFVLLKRLLRVDSVRGRDTHCWAPPAQIRASAIHALGSHLGCLTSKRCVGHG